MSPYPCRALRKLDAAFQCAAWHAGGGLRRVRGALGARHGEQHLCADWTRHAHRPVVQERRVRRACSRARHSVSGCGARRRSPALAPDHHDIVRVHLGCVPLWMASGSGAATRRVMGTAVIGGMLAATLIAIFLIPAAYLPRGAFRGQPSAGATRVVVVLCSSLSLLL
jgi:hypothetical protein